jgi:hypothetical protein
MLEIGPCDYVAEIEPLIQPSMSSSRTMTSPSTTPVADKAVQSDLLFAFTAKLRPASRGWRTAETAPDAAASKYG